MKPTLNYTQSLKLNPSLVHTQEMQQAFHILTLPVQEMQEWMITQIELNPVLEWKNSSPEEQDSIREVIAESSLNFSVFQEVDENFTKAFADDDPSLETAPPIEETIPGHTSMAAFLYSEIWDCFPLKIEREIALHILNSLSNRGFFDESIDSFSKHYNYDNKQVMRVLDRIKYFFASGIGCKNYQEALLIQLEMLQKDTSLAYQIILDHYDDLLENRLQKIAKVLKTSPEEIQTIIEEEIATLSIPSILEEDPIEDIPMSPDIHLTFDGKVWHIDILAPNVPPVHVIPFYKKYLETKEASHREKEAIKKYAHQGQWLFEIAKRRKNLLQNIVKYLIDNIADYLLGETNCLSPLKIKDLAVLLDVHESTATRSLANKYISCPRGIVPLRSLFSLPIHLEKAKEVSKQKAHSLLADLVKRENQESPFSDDELAKKLNEQGIQIQRRTITKYRKELGILSARHRRKFLPNDTPNTDS